MLLLLEAGLEVALVVVALRQQRREGFGSAVDLEEPGILVFPAGRDGVQVGLEGLDLPARGERTPTARFGGDFEKVDTAAPRKLLKTDPGVGYRQGVGEEEHGGLVCAGAPCGVASFEHANDAVSGGIDRPDSGRRATTVTADGALEAADQSMTFESRQHSGAGADAGDAGGMVPEMELVDVVRGEELVLDDGTQDGLVARRQQGAQPGDAERAEPVVRPHRRTSVCSDGNTAIAVLVGSRTGRVAASSRGTRQCDAGATGGATGGADFLGSGVMTVASFARWARRAGPLRPEELR